MPLRIRGPSKPLRPTAVQAEPASVLVDVSTKVSELKAEEDSGGQDIYSVADRLPCDIYNVTMRAGDAGAYEDTLPLPGLRVHFYTPQIVDLVMLNSAPAGAKVKLRAADGSSSDSITWNITGQCERVSLPWTVDAKPPPQLIPRIIHQTYISRALPAAGYRACQTWWLANPEYEYRFYDDATCQALMESWYGPDAPELEAYNMLYAGAYKSDIFRLALLYRVGGVWADVSSVCEAPLASYIGPDDEFVVCVDSPCQKRYANIHQAYLFVIPEHAAIAHILDYTVKTVLFRRFESPGMVFQSIAVTGPTAFAEGLNDYLGRRPLEFFDPPDHIHLFKDDDVSDNPFRFVPFVTEKGIRYLDHRNSKIWINPTTPVISTKYPHFSKYRTNVHYSILGNMGYIYKVKVVESTPSVTSLIPVWQVWLQTPFVSKQMAAAMQTWHEMALCEYHFMTEKTARAATAAVLPEVWQAIDMLRPHAYKCDLLRAVLLYVFGGLYVDADMVSLQTLEPLMQANDVLLLSSNSEQVDNGLMYFAKPGHPLLLHYLQRAVAQIKARAAVKSDLALTGPRLWTACIFEFWNWRSVPARSARSVSGDRIAILTHVAVTPTYVESTAVKALNLDEQRLTALRTVAPGTTVVTYADVPYVCTKYPDYNKERLIMGGTNFAAEYQAGAIYHT